VEVIVFTVDTDPVSRYDDFSGTDALLEAGRANADAVLDFWEAGGVGDPGEEQGPADDPLTAGEEAAAPA